METKENAVDNRAFYERTISATLKIGFLAIIFVSSFMIVKPFLVMVLWGIIIAIGVFPIFKKFSKLLGDKDKLASIILVILTIALITIPSYLLIDSTIESIQSISDQYKAGTLVIPPPSEDVAEWPIVGQPIYSIWKLSSTNIDAALKTIEPQIKEYGPKIVDSVAGLGGTVLLSIISIIIAGVLVLKSKSGEETSHKVFKFLLGKEGAEFTQIAIDTIRSVVQGVLGVALIQAVAAAIVLMIFNIPAAGLWALIVLILAIVQLPPSLILLPVSIYGFSIMDTTPAIILLVLSILISISDSFLKPMFLGRGMKIPMLVILLGAIGGMMLMGIMGLFVGSVALAMAYEIFQALIDNEKI